MVVDLIDKRLRNYRILRRLGAGGMGTVYLAKSLKSRRGLQSGDEVAVKVLHPHLAESGDLLRRFKREAGLGLAIQHPRVVATLDIGSEKVAGQTFHFLVMEYLPGPTLRQLLDREGALPEKRVVSIGRDLADGLSEVHRHGIIHRDLKPSNIFVDGDSVKIADLGLSRLLEPETEISLPGTVLGSVAYAPPEQMEGTTATPASDLYALGVILYELASARNPFLRDDFAATVRAHAEAVAPPLGRLTDVSYFLERVVAALLVKDPTSRLGPAVRLVRIFEERERSDFWREFVAGEEPTARLSAARRRLRVNRATRLHGRADALEAIVDVVRTAGVGRVGGMVVVSGEAGIGRTRLVDAAIDLTEQEGIPVQVFVSRFLDQATPVPYFALNAIVIDALELREMSRTERRMALPTLLRGYLPERGVFAESFAALIAGGNTDKLPRLPPDAIPAIYAEVFRTLAARHATVLVIEELQWADRGSLRVLERLFGSLGAYPLAVVATARDVDLIADDAPEEEEVGGRSARAMVLSLLTHDHVKPIHLERLDKASVAAVVRDLALPADRAERVVNRLYKLSEGNPAFLFALVDELDRGDRLRDIDAKEIERVPLPSSIRELIARRLTELDPEARRFVEFASVFGTRFKLEDVIEGLGLDVMTASEIVGRLRGRYRLLRVADQAYRFDHHLIKECLYRDLPAEQRRQDNLAVARILQRSIDDPHEPSQRAYEAAIHFSLAGEHAEAARHLIGGVRYLSGRSLYERAERFARQGVVHADQAPELDGTDRYLIHELLAEVSGHLGHRTEQGSALRLAARTACELGDERRMGEVEILMARHAGSTGRVFEALDHVERARARARRESFGDLQAAAIRVESSVLWLLGQTDHVDDLLEADRLAKEAGDELGRAFGLLQLGRLYLATDRPSVALATLKKGLRLFEQLEDQRGRGRSFFQIARVYREFGELGQATRAVSLADRVAHSNLDRGLAARCRFLRGEILLRRRSYHDAEVQLQQALLDLTAAADPTFQVYTLTALSLLFTASEYDERDPRRSVSLARQAVQVSRQIGVSRLTAYAYGVLAVAYLAASNTRYALAVSRKGIRYLEKENPGRKRASELLFVHYRCLKRGGRMGLAKDFLRRAHALVLERAEEIEQEGMRRSFLENDRFNAEVLKAGKSVLGLSAVVAST